MQIQIDQALQTQMNVLKNRMNSIFNDTLQTLRILSKNKSKQKNNHIEQRFKFQMLNYQEFMEENLDHYQKKQKKSKKSKHFSQKEQLGQFIQLIQKTIGSHKQYYQSQIKQSAAKQFVNQNLLNDFSKILRKEHIQINLELKQSTQAEFQQTVNALNIINQQKFFQDQQIKKKSSKVKQINSWGRSKRYVFKIFHKKICYFTHYIQQINQQQLKYQMMKVPYLDITNQQANNIIKKIVNSDKEIKLNGLIIIFEEI